MFAWIDAFLLPEPSRGGMDKDGLKWMADLPTAVAEAKAAGKKVFVDFTGTACTNCKLNERNVFILPEVKALFEKYQLVQMYTDVVPAQFYLRPPAEGARRADAAANLAFQNRKFGNVQLPLYVILDPQTDGKVVTIAVYDEGKINQVEQFVEFLRKPLAPDTARAGDELRFAPRRSQANLAAGSAAPRNERPYRPARNCATVCSKFE